LDVNRSGFIAIVGRPNVGKSTLLNAILGEKIAIVSNKPQTTRNKITGVLTKGDTQLVFLDTPGLHRARTKLGEYMVKTINSSIVDVDCAVLVVEPLKEQANAELEILQKLKDLGVPVVLAINKIDKFTEKEALMPVLTAWSKVFDFIAIVPVSAQNKSGIEPLTNEIIKLMPSGPKYFDEDALTDQPEREVAAEIIREKLLRLISDEIPHGTAVTIEKMHERDNGEMVDIEAVIYCEKESHKGIIIGKGGSMLKKVGSNARADIEKMIGCKVNLKLWVKVKDDWRNKEGALKNFGF
jgi:GTP-binding protein Era